MQNFKPLLKQELLRHIYSLKFITMCIFAVIVAILCVYVQIMDFKDRQKIYDEEEINAEQQRNSAKVYSQLTNPIIIKPNPLSIFCKGYDDKIGNRISISVIDIPEFEKTAQTKNSFLDIFLSFDLITLIQIIFSVMTLFIVTDTISGEREERTLKLVFSSSVLKFEFFLSKFSSSLLILSIPLALVFLITSLLLSLHSFITLSLAQWLTIFLIFLCCLTFISIYVLIGLIISSLTSTSSSSVLYGLLIWIMLVFIYPNTVNYFVSGAVKIPSSDFINQRIDQLHSDIRAQVNDEVNTKIGSWPRYRSYSYANIGGFYGLSSYIGITPKIEFEWLEEQVKIGIPIILRGQEVIYNTKKNFKHQLIKQKKISEYFFKLLPGFLLEESVSKMCGTHYIQREDRILEFAKMYRNQFIDYLKSKDAFGLRFFSRIKRIDMKENFDDYSQEIENRMNPDAFPPLQIADLPKFNFIPKSIVPADSLLSLGLLFLLNILLFIIGSYTFSNSDLRNRA